MRNIGKRMIQISILLIFFLSIAMVSATEDMNSDDICSISDEDIVLSDSGLESVDDRISEISSLSDSDDEINKDVGNSNEDLLDKENKNLLDVENEGLLGEEELLLNENNENLLDEEKDDVTIEVNYPAIVNENKVDLTIGVFDGMSPYVLCDVDVYLNENFVQKYIVDDDEYPITINNLVLGKNTIKFVYGGNQFYNPCTKEITVNYFNRDITIGISVDKTEVYVGEAVPIRFNASSSGVPIDNINVSLVVNDKDKGIFNINSMVSFFAATEGTFNIKAVFAGNEYFNPSESSVITVHASNKIINMDIDVVGNTVFVILNDSNGNPIANANLSAFINGEEQKLTTDSNGKANFIIETNSTINVTYKDSDYLTISQKVYAFYIGDKPIRRTTEILFKDMVTTVVDTKSDGRIGEYFTITLKDSKGNALTNKPVQIGFNGKVYPRTTDKNGQAKLQINLEREGIYTFAVSYLGDDEYNGSFVVAKITVNKQKGSLSVPNKSYAASAKTKALTASFKSAKGNLVANKKVSFTVNGKTYVATTNDKGVATVNVSLNKKGTYNFTVKFAGDSQYAAITKTGKLTIK